MSGRNPILHETVRAELDRIFASVTKEILSYSPPDPQLFVDALLGKVTVVNSYAERLLVTRVGERAVRIVRSFFDDVVAVRKPFDFEGTLVTSGRRYTVKVVSGPKAFNSTTRKAVEEASYGVSNPIILTLQGSFRDTHVKRIGAAKWYDGVATWSFLTGVRGAYRDFKRVVYEVGRKYRGQLISYMISLSRRE